jgi:hypothetical protein
MKERWKNGENKSAKKRCTARAETIDLVTMTKPD